MKYNIDYSVAGLLFTSIYYILLKTKYRNTTNSINYFGRLVAVLSIASLFDILSAVTISYSTVLPLWVNHFTNTVYYAAACLVSYVMSEYIRLLVHEDGKKNFVDKINRYIMYVAVLLCIANPFTHMFYSFTNDASRTYYHEPYWALIYVIILYFSFCAIARVFLHRQDTDEKKFYTIVIFVFFSIGGLALQYILGGRYLIAFFSASVSAFVVLFSLETPDYMKLTETMKELEESRSKLEKLRGMEAERNHTIHEMLKTASWVLYFDDKGQVIEGDWSDEFWYMLGYSDADKESMNSAEHNLWSESLHPEDAEAAQKSFVDGFMGAAPYNAEFRLRNKSGEYSWYRGSGELVKDKDGKVTSYQGYIQNIQDDKEKEVLTQDKLEALDKLEKSEAALVVALKDAKKANEAKSRFLSNMSHDIRTPMNAVIGFTDLALENLDDKEQVKDYLEKIQMSGDHLLMLINDILDMSRIESGKVVLKNEPCNIRILLQNVRDIFNSECTARKLNYLENISGIKDEMVICDRLRVNQILMNCMGNSVKFTPEGGNVGIRAYQQDDMYCIEVFDSGIGMSEKFVKKMFEPFEREHTSTISKTQGTGLGMSITKSLVDMMGGTIDVDSEVGIGTKFTVKFPLKKCEEAELPVNSDESASGVSYEEKVNVISGKRVLLVDDNKANRMVARGVLETVGVMAEEATNGREAIDMLSEEDEDTYDLILMDVQMPIMDGYEAADIIRKMDNEVKASIPIVAMTADAFDEDRRLSEHHGMNGHLPKPFKKEEIVNCIYRVLV